MRLKTARAARSASQSARPRARAKPSTRPSTWQPQPPLREQCNEYWNFFLSIAGTVDARSVSHTPGEGRCNCSQPLFEFSGACAGCGETPYIKLLTQLFGDRALIANATGCSSIYGGNLPTTPYTVNNEGRGPAWSNSLFEDNAEFGLGMRLAVDKQNEYARRAGRAPGVGRSAKIWSEAILSADQSTEEGISAQRERVKALKARLGERSSHQQRADLLAVADALVQKSVWIIGGDGWAYDIGYGGLDHVLASGRNVNILVLDTEVYSNTGGQMSKSTPRGAVAKFAAGGKHTPKKDLAMMAMNYGRVYVAHVAMGANDAQTMKAFLEAEAYDGPSLIIAYSHCIAHGYDMVHGTRPAESCGAAPATGRCSATTRALAQGRQESVRARFARAQHSAGAVHLQRNPLHDAGQQQSRRGQDAAARRRRITSTSAGSCTSTWPR